MRLSEAITKYIAFGKFKNRTSTMRGYENSLKQFILYMRDCEIEEVRLDDILTYLKEMERLGWNTGSLASKAGAYKQFFSFFKKQGYKVLEPELIPMPEIVSRFPKVLEEEDYKKLLKVTSEGTLIDIRNKLILTLLWDTGMRVGELLSLEQGMVDTKNSKAMIRTEKSKGMKPTRLVFWSTATNELVKKYLEKVKKTKYFFMGLGRLKQDQMSFLVPYTVLRKLSIKAGLDYVPNPHSFRHHFGRNLSLKGANAYVIGDLMGHADINSTRPYIMMNEQTMQDTYQKFFKD